MRNCIFALITMLVLSLSTLQPVYGSFPVEDDTVINQELLKTIESTKQSTGLESQDPNTDVDTSETLSEPEGQSQDVEVEIKEESQDTAQEDRKEEIKTEAAPEPENSQTKNTQMENLESQENLRESEDAITDRSNQIQKSAVQTTNVYVESNVSKLGRINNESVKIYSDITNLSNSFVAGSQYTDKVFYIKKQAKVEGEVYYKISTVSSATRGVIGWVKANDMFAQDHIGIDRQNKVFYIKGSGWSYTDAWGAEKDTIHNDLKGFKNQPFYVDLTEKVGEYIWYRGKLNGNIMWIQANNVSSMAPFLEEPVSKLGKINNSSVLIFQAPGNPSTSFDAGEKYTDKVFYIKRQTKINNETYYKISTVASSTAGVVGWVKANDMFAQNHVGVDKRAKSFYLKGSGWSYTDAWGSRRDVIHFDLTHLTNELFHVNLTEKVGNYIWYRGTVNGSTVWIQESNVSEKKVLIEKPISKLGRIVDKQIQIYPDLYDTERSFLAGNEYTDKVFYIKRQTEVDGEVYYKISTVSSATKGVIGWVKAREMYAQDHIGIDRQDKVFYLKGSGWSYTDAWGAGKDIIYKDLKGFENQPFNVDLTEKVGKYIWYRGKLNGKTMWIQAGNVIPYKVAPTSKLGKINGADTIIYKDLSDSNDTLKAGLLYTEKVFYIKQQAILNGETYYKISTVASSQNGVIGWVKKTDMWAQNHITIDRQAKTYYLRGTGWSYTTAWGDRKDVIFSDLSSYKNKPFNINLTEKVGDYIWYRGTLDGKQMWIQAGNISPINELMVSYNLTLENMINIQMKATPQTDKSYKLWIREDAFSSISNGTGIINGGTWNLRRGPGTMYAVGGQVSPGTELPLLDHTKGADGKTWYHVKNTAGWVIPDRSDLAYYINPLNFIDDFSSKLQFLNLSQSAGVDVEEVNRKILYGKGILEGKAGTFAYAGTKFNINEIYLISHALLETGNGKSELATGVKYNNKIVYNMYGVGAYDSCPMECGARHAYEQGWFTPEDAIIGGAEFVAQNYIAIGQNTLYKMRWNPLFAETNGYASHQYATDIGWALKQTNRMNSLYGLLDVYSLSFEIPIYK